MLHSRRRIRMESTKNRALGIPPGGRPHRRFRERSYLDPPAPAEIEKRQKLPVLASTFHDVEGYSWGPTTKILLTGVHDKTSPLSLLLGKEETIVEHIFSFVGSKWAKHITLTMPADAIGGVWGNEVYRRYDKGRNASARQREPKPKPVVYEEDIWLDKSGQRVQGLVSNVTVGKARFPDPMDRKVNMMPFVFGDESSLPENLKCYHCLIEACPYLEEEIGKVGYLTVQESYVDASKPQRRGGVHIENPGAFEDDSSSFSPGREWGCGRFEGVDRLKGGMFVASTVANTTVVWDALVNNKVKGMVDRHGGCEHLRPLLGPGRMLGANELVWMTDCTPHEAMPVTESGYRQFFRLVSSKVTHWYEEHSTPNPLVPLPDHVLVMKGNKFATSM